MQLTLSSRADESFHKSKMMWNKSTTTEWVGKINTDSHWTFKNLKINTQKADLGSVQHLTFSSVKL